MAFRDQFAIRTLVPRAMQMPHPGYSRTAPSAAPIAAPPVAAVAFAPAPAEAGERYPTQSQSWSRSPVTVVESSEVEGGADCWQLVPCLGRTGRPLLVEPAWTMPSLDSVGLPASVEVRVEPIAAAGEPRVTEMAERDALEVSVHLTAAAIPALVDYFAVGYDRAALQDRMLTLLGAEPSIWVTVQEFFFDEYEIEPTRFLAPMTTTSAMGQRANSTTRPCTMGAAIGLLRLRPCYFAAAAVRGRRHRPAVR